MRPALLLLLLAFVAFWPQLSSPEWHGTEARRVQIAFEMVQSGERMVPTLGGENTLVKPPLHYWVLSAVLGIFSVDDLQELDELNRRWLRLPALLAFWALAWVVFLVLRRSHGARAGWFSAMGILLSPVILHEAPSAEIDPLFTCLTVASILLLAQGVAVAERRWLAVAGVIGGMALLTKGPPYFLFLAGPLLVWLRHRKLWGAPYFLVPLLLVPLGYYVPLLRGEVDWQDLVAVASEERVIRAFPYEWAHLWNTPGYLLKACAMVLPLGFWALHEYRGVRVVQMEADALLLRFCSGSAVVAVVLLAFFPHRATRYLLPAVPVFLIALGPALAHVAHLDRSGTQVQRRLLAGLGLLGAAGLLVLPFCPYPLPGRSIGFALLLALAPALVERQAQLLAYALVLPLALAWTGLLDRAEQRLHSLRGLRAPAAILAREIEDRQAGGLHSWGHAHSAILLYGKLLPPADEFRRREPKADWLLHEEDSGDPRWREYAERLAGLGYADRLRVKLHDRSLVLKERVPR